jgi:dimethylhistidine N-methyltransferase
LADSIRDPGSAEFLEEFARDVQKGLGSTPKYLLAKYFYDETGSQLFEQITELPEYYPTRTEATILRKHAEEIWEALDGEISLVELGSGSSAKTTILLENILAEQKRLHYLPIDISPTILDETARRLDARYPELTTIPIASEYGEGLRRATQIAVEEPHVANRKLVIFLGSSIGNLEPKDARSFLRMIGEKMETEDAFLVGFDLQKDRKILEAAYNDEAGVTARFNRNILTRINRELGGDFVPDAFTHLAVYNHAAGRMELHLVSQSDHQVMIRNLGQSFSFAKGETIHTESSYKYTMTQIEDVAHVAGFKIHRLFTDDKQWFALALLNPV